MGKGGPSRPPFMKTSVFSKQTHHQGLPQLFLVLAWDSLPSAAGLTVSLILFHEAMHLHKASQGSGKETGVAGSNWREVFPRQGVGPLICLEGNDFSDVPNI